MVTLYNVIDIRRGKFHSVAEVKEDDAKYFVAAKQTETSAPAPKKRKK